MDTNGATDVCNPEFARQFAELVARLEAGDPMPLHLGCGAAVLLIAQVQLALRHPENNGPTARIARGFLDTIISAVARRAGEQEGPGAAVIAMRGLQAGFDLDVQPIDVPVHPAAAAQPWFSNWFGAMPPAWQEGLAGALEGRPWTGELTGADGKAAVHVLYLPAELGERVTAAIERGDYP